MALHETLRPISWILGRWSCLRTRGHYPTMKDFFYREEAEFSHFGAPYIQYSLYSFDCETNAPMHRDIGFLKVAPDGNRVALVSAQHFGFAEVEEGTIERDSIKLETTSVGQTSFSGVPDVTKIVRNFSLKDGKLVQVVHMETSKTPLTEHLHVVYERVNTDA